MPALRRLAIDDYDSIMALWQRAGLHSIRPGGRDGRSEFAQQLDRGQVAIGLEEDGKLIGVVLATHNTRKGWINRLAIDPDCRRKGYGAQLIHAAEAALYKVGMKAIAALIEDDNDVSAILNMRKMDVGSCDFSRFLTANHD